MATRDDLIGRYLAYLQVCNQRAWDELPRFLANTVVVNESTTTSELLQQHLPQSQVVKAFNNIYVSHLATLARPAGDGERTALPIAGDDPAAKDVVAAFLDAIGYEAYDVGPLSQGWRYQRDTAAYVQPYAAPGTSYPDWSGRSVTAQMLKEKLDAAVRYRDR